MRSSVQHAAGKAQHISSRYVATISDVSLKASCVMEVRLSWLHGAPVSEYSDSSLRGSLDAIHCIIHDSRIFFANHLKVRLLVLVWVDTSTDLQSSIGVWPPSIVQKTLKDLSTHAPHDYPALAMGSDLQVAVLSENTFGKL